MDPNGGIIPATTGWAISSNGYSKSSASKMVTYDNTYGSFPTPTKVGYTFGNWINIYNYGNKTLSAEITIIDILHYRRGLFF